MTASYAPPDTPLSIVHADATVVVADKPAGLLTVPGRGEDLADCLFSRLQAVYPGVRLVHRLDRDTSGLVVFALSTPAQAELGRQFEARTVDKRYCALVHGVPEGTKGRIDLPLIVDWPNRPRQKVCPETGRPAQTDWRVLKAEGDAVTRLQLIPRTGRTHQLRVHMLAVGHPILGDTLYDPGRAEAPDRLMLHAERLAFDHPETGVRLAFRVRAPF